ncbi:MAG: hypothetical protein HPZ91_15205 [Lentisphaeria bacterium]|nr:hypothetical protein [Lentisphaeria bacterium]
MYCPQCGFKNAETSKRCRTCGVSLEDSSKALPSCCGAFNTAMIFALLVTLLGCTVPGIIAVIYAAEASIYRRTGYLSEERKATGKSYIWSLITVALTVVILACKYA